MSKEDVWQSEPTVIKPSPGGNKPRKQAGESTALFTALESSEPASPIDFRASGMPFLVSAARPQLNLLDRLRSLPDIADPEQLRIAAVEEMRAYERKVANAGVDVEHARIAHYVLCATIDDVVLATPWGAGSDWGSNSLVSTFHRDVQGGERVFDLLEHLHRDPGRNRDVLMLLYLCLSLGFRGRLRVTPRGALELSHMRDSLYRTLQGTMGDIERELSPNWRGVNARNARSGWRHLLPAALAFLLLAVALGYIGILNLLNTESDRLIVSVAGLPPNGVPSIKVSQPLGQPAEPDDALGQFVRFLKPEIDKGTVTVSRNGNEVLVRFRNTGFFTPGSATVSPTFERLLDRVAKAIADAKFSVMVTGHTDNRPIRTVRFPSNWHLSTERAKAVADVLSRQVQGERVAHEGRGETEPVDTNDTSAGREANRRTEVLVRYTKDTDRNVTVEGAGQQP
jgi:type VI secretion system protein ImpK